MDTGAASAPNSRTAWSSDCFIPTPTAFPTLIYHRRGRQVDLWIWWYGDRLQMKQQPDIKAAQDRL